jgi:DNA-binding transcriptional ArsR family regulator
MDAASLTKGSLPKHATIRDHSLWLDGNFALRLEAKNGRSGPSYHATLAGLATAYSVAGLEVVRLARDPMAASLVAILGLLVVATLGLMARGGALVGHWIAWHPFFSRVAPDQVALSPVRQRILSMIHERPFARLSEICRTASRQLGLSKFAVYYHLRLLYDAGHLDVLADRKRSLFIGLRNGSTQPFARGVGGLAAWNQTAQAVLKAVSIRPGCGQAEIIREAQQLLMNLTGRSPTRIAIHKWLRLLASPDAARTRLRVLGNRNVDGATESPAALIEVERLGRAVRYRPSALLADFLKAERQVGGGLVGLVLDKSD